MKLRRDSWGRGDRPGRAVWVQKATSTLLRCLAWGSGLKVKQPWPLPSPPRWSVCPRGVPCSLPCWLAGPPGQAPPDWPSGSGQAGTPRCLGALPLTSRSPGLLGLAALGFRHPPPPGLGLAQRVRTEGRWG